MDARLTVAGKPIPITGISLSVGVNAIDCTPPGSEHKEYRECSDCGGQHWSLVFICAKELEKMGGSAEMQFSEGVLYLGKITDVERVASLSEGILYHTTGWGKLERKN